MSHLDDLIEDIEARYADATVHFEGGKLATQKHQQQRAILIVRSSGVLKFSAAPDRRPFGIPLSGVGTFTEQRFERAERFVATLRAATEDDLDAMFDRFVNTVFEVCGPNAFDAESPYEWFQRDSTSGGDWVRRNPAIVIQFTARLKSRSQPYTFVQVAAAEADLELKDATGATGATGEAVHVDTPVPE